MSVTEKVFWNEGIKEGQKLEQERIVNLLEESSKCRLDGGHDAKGFCFCEAIALIKGEQK